MNASQQPMGWISIGTLARLSGVPTETIRTWERRYGSPVARRLDSGHRRYNTAEASRLRLVKTLIDAGHRASETLTLSLEDLQRASDAAIKLDSGLGSDLNGQLMQAIREMNQLDFPGLLSRIWDEFGALTFLEDVVGPLLTDVGRAWHDGEMSVAQEHFASEHIVHILSQRWRSMQQSTPGVRWLFATLPEERHFVGLHMAAVTCSLFGCGVVWLGADAPLNEIVTAAETQGVSAVVLSLSVWQKSERAAHVAQLRELLPAEIELIIGGRGAPKMMPNVHYTENFRNLGDLVRTEIAREVAKVSQT